MTVKQTQNGLQFRGILGLLPSMRQRFWLYSKGILQPLAVPGRRLVRPGINLVPFLKRSLANAGLININTRLVSKPDPPTLTCGPKERIHTVSLDFVCIQMPAQ